MCLRCGGTECGVVSLVLRWKRLLAADLGSHCLGSEGGQEGRGTAQSQRIRGGRLEEGDLLSFGLSSEEREKSRVDSILEGRGNLFLEEGMGGEEKGEP